MFVAAFGSLILLSMTWPRTKGAGALTGMITAAATVMIWIAMAWNSSFLSGPGVHEIIPGFILAWATIMGVSLITEDTGSPRPPEPPRPESFSR